MSGCGIGEQLVALRNAGVISEVPESADWMPLPATINAAAAKKAVKMLAQYPERVKALRLGKRNSLVDDSEKTEEEKQAEREAEKEEEAEVQQKRQKSARSLAKAMKGKTANGEKEKVTKRRSKRKRPASEEEEEEAKEGRGR